MDISELYPQHPIFDPKNVCKLKQFNIKTVTDLLGRDAEQVSSILEVSYTQVAKLLDQLFVTHCGFSVSALEIHHRNLQNEIVFKTGVASFDSLLMGGFKTGKLYEVFGPPGAGKSQLCFTLSAAGVLKSGDLQVVYVDTKNDLVPERVLQILQARASGDADVKYLNRVLVHKSFDAHTCSESLSDVIDKLKKHLSQVRLVIVDNIVSPVLSTLTEDIATAFFHSSKMSQQLQQLSSLGCCVVAVNNSRMSGEEIKPALGKIWDSLADVRIKVERAEDSGRREMEIVHGIKKSKNKKCSFTIDKAGISS